MKHLLIITSLLLLLSCNKKDSKEIYFNALPGSIEINDVISSLTEIDSFRKDYKILETIINPIVYVSPKWENDSIPLPPPPPESILQDEIFNFFSDDSLYANRIRDSIFISLQSDTSRKFTVNKLLLSGFNNDSYRYYRFNTPIFSFDKQKVIVMYWRVCGGLCGNCQLVFLKKEGSSWLKVNSYGCGEM